MAFVPFTINENLFIPVDDWYPQPEDCILRNTKNFIIMPVSAYYGAEGDNLDYFDVSIKKAYDSDIMREHTCHYINYFLRFYDHDKELLMYYFRMKFFIDINTEVYTFEALMYDIFMYILSPSMMAKIDKMNADNYSLNLKYKNNKHQSLQYTNEHAMILMKISLIFNMIIPVICHFADRNNVNDINEFILSIYDRIFDLFPKVDIYNKLYETSLFNVDKDKDVHKTIWDMQSIRGTNITTHSYESVENIILNIICKYNYNKNIIYYNLRSVNENSGYNIYYIPYNYNFVPLSASNRDMEDNSQYDKFESTLIKQDESLFVQINVTFLETMKIIENKFGPFSDEEVQYYMDRLEINDFQKEIIFNLFYKYFGDTMSPKSVDKTNYIKLMLAAKKMLLHVGNMVILPYIISGKITKFINRKNLNKTEFLKVTSSFLYNKIKGKYCSDKIEKYIMSLIASILSSDFELIDYDNQDLNGTSLNIHSDLLCEEVLLYIDII